MADGTDGIDPPWRLDPFQNIVNVSFDDYRLVTFLVGSFSGGSPTFTVRFETPKTYHSYPEVNSSNPTINPPAYNGNVSVPSPVNNSPNSTGAPFISENPYVTGNLVFAIRPQGAPDYRGYVTMQCGTWVPNEGEGGGFVPDYNKTLYFDYNGKPIPKIPDPSTAIQTKGAFMASDEDGDVYFSLGTYGQPIGLTKYDSNGNKLWTKGADPVPESAHYDPVAKQIAVFTTSSITSDTGGETDYFDLTGAKVRTVIISDSQTDQGAFEVTRNGIFFVGWSDGSGETYEGWSAYSPDGAKLWSINGESNTSGTDLESPVAYGEEYVIFTTRLTHPPVTSGFPPLLGDPPFVQTTSYDFGCRILRVSNGSAAANVVFGTGQQIFTQSAVPLGDGGYTQTDYEVTFGELGYVARSAYYP